MYYELYIDVLFLVNFMMDYLLLQLIKKMLSCSATHIRICAGAAMGSLLTCLIMILPAKLCLLKFVLFHGFVNTYMIRVGLKIKELRKLIKALLLLYIGGVFMGGILEALHPYVKTGSLLLVFGILGYYISIGVWNFLSYMNRVQRRHCQAEIYYMEKRICVQCLIDTGNCLCDPLTGKPVSVISKAAAIKILPEQELATMRKISYQSIGTEQGMIPVLEVDQIHIQAEREKWLAKPLIGISDIEVFSSNTYEMILSPDLL